MKTLTDDADPYWTRYRKLLLGFSKPVMSVKKPFQ
jgi:hypothetical protein